MISSSNYNGAATVHIYNVSGQLLIARQILVKNNRASIDIDLSNGMYYIYITDAKNGYAAKKVVVNR